MPKDEQQENKQPEKAEQDNQQEKLPEYLKPKIEKKNVAVTSLDPPESFYSPNRLNRDYSTVVDGLSELLGVFSSGVDSPEKAKNVKTFLSSRDTDKKIYSNVFMKTIKDGKLSFNSTGDNPTAEEVLRVAKHTYIIENDGTISNYAEKFFANDSMDALLKDESISPQELGTMMAIHMALFFSKTPDSPIKGMDETFGDINPGTTDGREPLRVYITVPGHSPAAIAGKDFVKAYEAATGKATEQTLTVEYNAHLNYQEKYEDNKEKWSRDIDNYSKAIERDRTKYENAQKKLTDSMVENEKKFSEWEKSFNEKYPTDEARKKELEENEWNEHYKWVNEQGDKVYQPQFDDFDNSTNQYKQVLDNERSNPVTVPAEPVESNFFRRLWVRLGGSHSREYIRAVEARNDAINRKNDQDATIASLEEEISKIADKKRKLTLELDDAAEKHRLETEERVKNLPDVKGFKENEIKKQRKELLEDTEKQLKAEVEAAKKKYEETVRILEPEIERLKKLTVNAEKEFNKRAGDMAKKQQAIENKDEMLKLVDKVISNANKTAAELMKKSELRQKNEINVRFKDEGMSEFIMRSDVDTLAEGSVTSILDIASQRAKYKEDFDEKEKSVSGLYASEIFMSVDPKFLQETAEYAKDYAKKWIDPTGKKNENQIAKKRFYEVCCDEYIKRKEKAVEAFEETFNIRCNLKNVQSVIDQLNIKGFVEYAVKNVDGKIPNEHPMPKVTKTNVKDMVYLIMTGLKTAKILEANNGNIEILKSGDVKVRDVDPSELKTKSTMQPVGAPAAPKLKALPAGPSM